MGQTIDQLLASQMFSKKGNFHVEKINHKVNQRHQKKLNENEINI